MGFFKPNISTMVGRMYSASDPRRDGAFTIFYMGVNLGAFLSSIICPSLRAWRGFDWGFGAAGVGMVIGLIVFLVGQRRVVGDIEAAGNSAKIVDKATRNTSKIRAKLGTATRPKWKWRRPTQTGRRRRGSRECCAENLPILHDSSGDRDCCTLHLQGFDARCRKPIALVMPIAFGAVFVVMAILLMRLRGAQKDKSTSIFIMFLFPSFSGWRLNRQAMR